jgi:hypothetical protein
MLLLRLTTSILETVKAITDRGMTLVSVADAASTLQLPQAE